MIWVLFACNEDVVSYKDITSREEVVVDTSDTDTEDTDTGDTDTSETGISETGTSDTNTDAMMTFHAPLMTCEQIGMRTMTLTNMVPGETDEVTGQDTVFKREAARIQLDTLSLTEESDGGCTFSIPLPNANVEDGVSDQDSVEDQDYMSIDVGGQNNVRLAIYYPATFVQHSVECQRSTDVDDTDKVSCNSTYSKPGLETDTSDTGLETSEASQDVEESAPNIYDWGSDVLPVYVETVPEGAFEDLGFAQGWNLARFVQGEIVLVEPLDSLDALSQVVLDNSAFLPRYEINGLGSTSVNANFGEEYSIGLLPAHWLYSDTSSVDPCQNQDLITCKTMHIQDEETSVSWSIDVWDQPSTSQFIGTTIPTDSSYYLQWSSTVDVAVFVPLVFTGAPSTYDTSGNLVEGDDIAIQSSRNGAVCKDSSTLAFVFYEEPRKPSEIYWYSLVGHSPGWYAVYGTQGYPDTWRMVLENTDVSSPYTYTSLSIGGACQVPEGWRLSDAQGAE